jgi:hypothetical protein
MGVEAFRSEAFRSEDLRDLRDLRHPDPRDPEAFKAPCRRKSTGVKKRSRFS